MVTGTSATTVPATESHTDRMESLPAVTRRLPAGEYAIVESEPTFAGGYCHGVPCGIANKFKRLLPIASQRSSGVKFNPKTVLYVEGMVVTWEPSATRQIEAAGP